MDPISTTYKILLLTNTVAVLACWRTLQKELGALRWIIVGITVAEIIGLLLGVFIRNSQPAYVALTLFELPFFAAFFLRVMETQKDRGLVKALFAALQVSMVVYYIIYRPWDRFPSVMILSVGVMVVAGSLLYLRQVLRSDVTVDIWRNDRLLVVLAFFLYYSATSVVWVIRSNVVLGDGIYLPMLVNALVSYLSYMLIGFVLLRKLAHTFPQPGIAR